MTNSNMHMIGSSFSTSALDDETRIKLSMKTERWLGLRRFDPLKA